MERCFEACEPNGLWVADTTGVSTREGFPYLTTVLDVFGRRVVGWAMGVRQTAALDMAFKAGAANGVIFHCDHGSQFPALVFTSRCEQAGVLQFMGAVGSCYYNAMAESFFATIECELLRRTPFATREEAATGIFRFLEGFYNP